MSFYDGLVKGIDVGTDIYTLKNKEKRANEKHGYEMSEAKAAQDDRERQQNSRKALLDYGAGLSAGGQPAQSQVDQTGVNQPMASPMAGGIAQSQPSQPMAPAQVGGAIQPVQQQVMPQQQVIPQQAGITPQFQPPAQQPQPQPQQDNTPLDFNAVREKISQGQALAAQNPEQAHQFNALMDNYKQQAMTKWRDGYKGDTSTLQGIRDYTSHMAKGAANLSGYMSPEDAKKNYDTIKSMKKEGYYEALDLIDSGDMEGANKLWNGSGKMRGTITNPQPSTFMGVPSKTYDLIGETGEKLGSFNTGQQRFNGQAYEQQVEMSLKDDKQKTDKKNIESQISDRAADNKREDIKQKQSSISVVQGESDQYVIDSNPMSMGATALGIGSSKPGKGSGNGGEKKWSDMDRNTKGALQAFETGHGITRTTAGDIMQYGDVKDNMDFYVPIMSIIDDKVVKEGMSAGDAAAYAESIYNQATRIRSDHNKKYSGKESAPYIDAIGMAKKEIERKLDIINKSSGDAATGGVSDDIRRIWK
jgi:hypothetical protein